MSAAVEEDPPPRDLVDWAREEIGTIGNVELLSTSNSRVWRVWTASGDWVLKDLRDLSSSPRVEAKVLAELRHRDDVRQLKAMRSRPDGSTHLIAEYVPGRTLDEVLATAAPTDVRGWAGQLTGLIDAVSRIPVTGFGKVAVGAHGLCADEETWPGFLRSYLEVQRGKAPRVADLRYERLSHALSARHTELAAAAPRPRPVLADVNLRNFLVSEQGLVCGNIPVLWAGDPAAAHGEALLHWSGTAGEAMLTSAAATAPRLLHFYAVFHAYVILAYVERFSAEPLDRATPWGSRTPLLELLDNHLRLAEEG